MGHSIDLAKKIEAVNKIFVSTDDQAIALVAQKYGANIINRPTELAQDDTPEWLAWKHAVAWVEENEEQFDTFISIPTTSPLRDKGDVEACLALLDDDTDMVITITDTNRSPWFNMIHITENHYAKLVIDSDKQYIRRQDVPEAYDMTTVAYVTRPEFIRDSNGIFEGRVKAVKIPKERAIDIDTELDLEIAEFLFHKINSSNKGQKDVK